MIAMTNRPVDYRKTQSGAALVISLLLLLVMTILGVTAMSNTVLEEKMTSNARQRQLAFQSASTALRTAEAWLTNNITSVAQFETTFSGTPNELYWVRQPSPGVVPRAVPMNIFDGTAWVAGNSQLDTSTLVTGQPGPRYVIEYMGRKGEPPLDYTVPDNREYTFRITAIGWGTDSTTTYVAQSAMRMQLL